MPKRTRSQGAFRCRTLRLNCLTVDYAPLWEWTCLTSLWQTDGWTDPNLTRFIRLVTSSGRGRWGRRLRRDQDRWQALVEVDTLAALMLGLTAEQLCAMYRTQFAVLRKYEYKMVFDAEGRKICGCPPERRLPAVAAPRPGEERGPPRRMEEPLEPLRTARVRAWLGSTGSSDTPHRSLGSTVRSRRLAPDKGVRTTSRSWRVRSRMTSHVVPAP